MKFTRNVINHMENISVTLQMNSNSLVLTNKWQKFMLAYDNAAEHVAAGNHQNYKIGIVPGQG